MTDGVSLPRFSLSLLGRIELTGADGLVDLPNKKLAGLLAYLACTAPRPQSRERLSALLWGSHFDAQARLNLRQALFRLRKVLGQDALESDGEAVSLNAAIVRCDVGRFEALVREGGRDALTAAADLYRGPLIDDVVINEEGWSEWLTGERGRLLDLALGALLKLAEQELTDGRAREALKAGRRAIALDSMREDAHRIVIRALVAAGRKAEALKHYQELLVLLKCELNAEPDEATRSLAAELRRAQPPIAGPLFPDRSSDADEGACPKELLTPDDIVSGALPARSSTPERRQLTIVVCNMLGSPGAAHLDPEDIRDLIAAFHETVANVVAQFDGYVAQCLVDRVVVYFGYPAAREHDAEQAVRAGIAIHHAAGKLDGFSDKGIQAQVGIATGLVVVDEKVDSAGIRQPVAIGQTPNLAAQLQAVAAPGEVVIGASTHHLVGRLFDCRTLTADNPKGSPPSVEAWQVRGELTGVSRFEARRAGRLSPLVGRQEEMRLLLRRWQQAKTGDGRVVLISGEPGIGKSRLTSAVSERVACEPHVRLSYFCSPQYTDTALYPFTEQLEHAAHYEQNESPDARLNKLDSLLDLVATSPEDRALIAELLSLPGAWHRHPVLDLTPQIRKQRTLEALVHQVEMLAGRQPILMLFEDVHWSDPTSVELLDRTIERVRRLPVLLLVTFRPEFIAPWIGQSHVTTISLRRLDPRESTTLAAHMVQARTFPARLLEEIVGRADGVPLFLEELTKAVAEAPKNEAQGIVAASPASLTTIPASLYTSLAARLDRLGPSKDIAQIGAIIGREFSYELLRDLMPLPESELRSAVNRLVASELVMQRGAPPTSSYLFKHALVQQTAYEMLLRADRRKLHGYVADLLKQKPEMVERHPEVLAQHYAEAGLNDKAVQYWIQAGNRSIARSAMGEAEAQFQKALTRIPILPETRERALLELEIQSSLGSLRLAISGFTAPHVAQTYERARELWEQLGCPPEFIRVPWGQFMYHVNRAELTRARVLGESLMDLAELRHDQAALLPAGLCMGGLDLACGNFARSRSHLEEANRIYNPEFRSKFIQTLGFDPHVHALSFLSLTLLLLGYPDQALARRKEAISEARESNHRPSLAIALSSTSRLLACLGDHCLLAESAGELVTLATEQGFPYWLRQGEMYQGVAEIRNGVIDAGLSRVRNGAAAFQATGAELWMPMYRAIEAQAETLKDNTDVAMTVLDDALRSSRARGEDWFEAELIRRKGELLRSCHFTMAEALFREAIDIAVRQEAKLWELRATVSLAGLYADVGRRNKAYKMLAPVYSWFTEGFDTPDLKQTRALLDELAS